MVQKTAAQKILEVIQIMTGLVSSGEDTTADQILDQLVREHQLLISMGYIELSAPVVMWAMGNGVEGDERMQLINGIATYHRLINRQPKATAPDWLAVDDVFSVIEPHKPLVQFLVLNYRFLCLRNAEQYDQLAEIYSQALDVAERIADVEIRREHLGYITYNYSRLQVKLGNISVAKEMYMLAGVHRTGYLQLLRNRKAPQEKLFSAAQQVAKLFVDWPNFFGKDCNEDCPVIDQEYASLREEFGPELDAFSATKK